MTQFNFLCSRIYNFGETALCIVTEVPKVVASKGQKKVAQATLAERGFQITTSMQVGIRLPTVYIFPDQLNTRKLSTNVLDPVKNKETVNGDPDDIVRYFSKKGWITNEIFVEVLHHLQHQIQTSPNNRVLFLWTIIRVTALTMSFNMRRIPPYLTNPIQLLGTNCFAPFKESMRISMKDFLDFNQKIIRVGLLDLPAISKNPYNNVFVPDKIKKSFEHTGS